MQVKMLIKKCKLVLGTVLVGFVLFGAATTSIAANDTSASVMRLEKTTGDVTLTSSSGKASQIIEKMRLNSGDDIKSQSKSYAYISLDESKAVKLDANSEATVNKSGNKLKVELKSGNLIFDVEKALKSYESLEIQTANMTMGIRGTCAQVEVRSANVTSISLLDGSLSCTVTDRNTGRSQSITLSAGDHADFCTGPGYLNNCQIITRKAVTEDVRGFALDYIYDKVSLSQKIYDQSGLDFRYISRKQVDDRISLDEGGGRVTINTGRTSPEARYYYGGN